MANENGKRSCAAANRAGKPCHAAPLSDSSFCLAHADQETRERTGFGGAQPRAGRPPLPRPHEALREKVEADIDRWLAPYERARDAKRAVVVGSGRNARIELVDDHATQLRAADAVLDRIYGKARTSVEIKDLDEKISAQKSIEEIERFLEEHDEQLRESRG